MKHYHKNPRTLTERQFKDLRAWLKELGDLGGIVHDLNSDEIIGGNQRIRALDLMGAEPVIVERFDPPTEQGTVARGYFERHGERYDYRAVRWTPRQCEKANVIANKAGGGWDFDILANDFELPDLLEWGFSEGELTGWGTGAEFKEYDESVADDVEYITCPECGHKWPK